MKILFDNVLLAATLAAGSASANYPVENLVHRFLKKRYQHTAAVFDTVTITLDSSTDINYFFAGYSNASQIVVRLYSSAPALLKTDTITSIGDDTKSIKYDQTYSVKTIEIDVYGGVGGYLGGVGAGVIEDFKNPLSPWEEPYQDNTKINSSDEGQTTRNKRRPLKLYSWVFKDLTRSECNEKREIYLNNSIGAIVWLDPFEDGGDFMQPLYAIIENPPLDTKNGRRYDQQWSFREAR
jgi:hypothetical protein